MHKVAVVSFPGSNCDGDTVWALEQLGVKAIRRWYRDRDLGGADSVLLPGGFSYGDYLRSGALAARTPIMDVIEDGVQANTLRVMGICNGFQILCERGLLPGALRMNQSGSFRCTWETVRVVTPPAGTGFATGQRFRLPIAHREGAYTLEPGQLAPLFEQGQAFLQYANRDGYASPIDNPNGSVANLAGISRGSVVGLMPHPERAAAEYLGSSDGLRFLQIWLEGARE